MKTTLQILGISLLTTPVDAVEAVSVCDQKLGQAENLVGSSDWISERLAEISDSSGPSSLQSLDSALEQEIWSRISKLLSQISVAVRTLGREPSANERTQMKSLRDLDSELMLLSRLRLDRLTQEHLQKLAHMLDESEIRSKLVDRRSQRQSLNLALGADRTLDLFVHLRFSLEILLLEKLSANLRRKEFDNTRSKLRRAMSTLAGGSPLAVEDLKALALDLQTLAAMLVLEFRDLSARRLFCDQYFKEIADWIHLMRLALLQGADGSLIKIAQDFGNRLEEVEGALENLDPDRQLTELVSQLRFSPLDGRGRAQGVDSHLPWILDDRYLEAARSAAIKN